MDRSHLESRLLRYVNRANYKPVKPRVIAKKLNLSDGEQRELKRSIKRLVSEGKLAYGSRHLVCPARAGTLPQQVTGVYRRTRHGFGFVRPTAGSRDREPDRLLRRY